MNKEIAFFDLDNTLWYIKSDFWIIDKNNPSVSILKISPIEFALIKSGIYVKDDILIEYNGESYFISRDMLERIQRKSKNVRIGNLGISYTEFFDDNILNKKDVKLLLNNIKHLIGKNIEIGVLTARSDRKKHAELLNKLRLKLKEFGLEISKVYFVSESIKAVGYQDKVSYNKNKILLEHLIGLKIEDNKFVPIKKESYNKVYFYDDLKSNIMSSNSLQEYFDFLVRNSDDDCVEYINDRLENNSLMLINNLITNNEMNPFETKIIKLISPIKFPLKVDDNKLTIKFEKFINKF
jgi:hypothetical protein